MVVIGLIINESNSKLTKVVKNYLKKGDKSVEVLTIEELERDIKFDSYYNIIEIPIKEVNCEKYDDLKFDIILECLLEVDKNDLKGLQHILNKTNENGYFIFNSDYIEKINFKCKDIYPITYGLNGKSSVTASSINDVNLLEFSICLQRTILTIDRNIIQPFEKPIKVDSSVLELNYYIAALTLIIVLGYKF